MNRKLTQLVFLSAMTLFSHAAYAQSWQLQVGAETGDRAHQALAFLPNEIWIHQGDSITWSFPSNEVHTVTFLKPGQVRPNRFVGCAGTNITPNFSLFDGTACVNSGILTNASEQTYTVVFPVTVTLTRVACCAWRCALVTDSCVTR